MTVYVVIINISGSQVKQPNGLRLRINSHFAYDDWLLEKVKTNEARDRTGSLILCSQFAPAAWHAKLGNGAIADAVIDRVVYKSHVIHIEGEESMRKRMGGIG